MVSQSVWAAHRSREQDCQRTARSANRRAACCATSYVDPSRRTRVTVVDSPHTPVRRWPRTPMVRAGVRGQQWRRSRWRRDRASDRRESTGPPHVGRRRGHPQRARVVTMPLAIVSADRRDARASRQPAEAAPQPAKRQREADGAPVRRTQARRRHRGRRDRSGARRATSSSTATPSAASPRATASSTADVLALQRPGLVEPHLPRSDAQPRWFRRRTARLRAPAPSRRDRPVHGRRRRHDQRHRRSGTASTPRAC